MNIVKIYIIPFFVGSLVHIVNTVYNDELKHIYTYDLIEFDKLASINSLKNNISTCIQKYNYNQVGLVSRKEIIHSDNEKIIEVYEYNRLNKLVSIFASGNKLSNLKTSDILNLNISLMIFLVILQR